MTDVQAIWSSARTWGEALQCSCVFSPQFWSRRFSLTGTTGRTMEGITTASSGEGWGESTAASPFSTAWRTSCSPCPSSTPPPGSSSDIQSSPRWTLRPPSSPPPTSSWPSYRVGKKTKLGKILYCSYFSVFPTDRNDSVQTVCDLQQDRSPLG